MNTEPQCNTAQDTCAKAPVGAMLGCANTCEQSEPSGCSFSEALEELKSGGAISRYGWHRQEMYLKLQSPDPFSKMTEPYIYMVITKNGTASISDFNRHDGATRVPWLASQTDLLSHDWYFVSPK